MKEHVAGVSALCEVRCSEQCALVDKRRPRPIIDGSPPVEGILHLHQAFKINFSTISLWAVSGWPQPIACFYLTLSSAFSHVVLHVVLHLIHSSLLCSACRMRPRQPTNPKSTVAPLLPPQLGLSHFVPSCHFLSAAVCKLCNNRCSRHRFFTPIPLFFAKPLK